MSKKSKTNSKTTVSPLMKTLATYMAGAAKKPLPKHVAEKTKHHLLDTLAATISGSRLLPGKVTIAYLKTQGGTPEACVPGTRIVTTASNAAFGSGEKTLHNVVGLIGVLEGNGGDLRVGLPMQSVHDGARFVHEPLRLNVFIEAPVARARTPVQSEVATDSAELTRRVNAMFGKGLPA